MLRDSYLFIELPAQRLSFRWSHTSHSVASATILNGWHISSMPMCVSLSSFNQHPHRTKASFIARARQRTTTAQNENDDDDDGLEQGYIMLSWPTALIPNHWFSTALKKCKRYSVLLWVIIFLAIWPEQKYEIPKRNKILNVFSIFTTYTKPHHRHRLLVKEPRS